MPAKLRHKPVPAATSKEFQRFCPDPKRSVVTRGMELSLGHPRSNQLEHPRISEVSKNHYGGGPKGDCGPAIAGLYKTSCDRSMDNDHFRRDLLRVKDSTVHS